MTAAFLQSELTSLISDSKRKHSEIRTAAEKSLAELKAISVTSETQLAGDLLRKPHFIDPFLLACKSQVVKLASNGAASLQRLVAATAIPRSRLPDVLQAFEEGAPLALEVQLKVLQTLPSLLQLYAADLHGEALARTLSVSADLSSSKLPMVSSTASATFQQLVNAVFARTVPGTNSSRRGNEEDSARDHEDALAIFNDLCALLTEGNPEFVRLENLPPPLILETIESLLSIHGSLILRDSDALKACSSSLLPGISRLIESSANYGVVVRAFRIVFVLATQHLTKLNSSLEEPFRVILKYADRQSHHKWKRALSLEFFRGFCSDFDALRSAFALFDLKNEKSNLVSDMMASLVRTASEDPSLIGLGRQSTIPVSRANENTSDVTTSMDVASTGVTQAGASVGISTEWSSMPNSCLDILDRANAVEIPETYIYTLVLGCISAFSDGLSKFIMPLSIPNRKMSKVEENGVEVLDTVEVGRRPSQRKTPALQKYQQLVNPLSRQDFPKRDTVEACAHMIESCWPAVLATCSTFLNAALDSYYYHMLIRTVQKLTQVSGVLELDTPRDALLTTLAKVSVPANVSSTMNAYYGTKPAVLMDFEEIVEADDPSLKSPVASTPRQSIEISTQPLNVRNLMCLRALLNLGIALGPTLSQTAWTIIMQALQQVEALMSVGPNAKLLQLTSSNGESAENQPSNSLASEISAVETARRRMVESTRTYSDQPFETVCHSLLHMIDDIVPSQVTVGAQEAYSTENLRPRPPMHKTTRSISGTWAKAITLEIEVQFVLKSLGRLASVNLHRFRDPAVGQIPWDLVITKLLLLQSNPRLLPHLQVQCANIIDALVVEACSSIADDEDDLNEHHGPLTAVRYGIPALGKQYENLSQLLSIGKHNDVVVKMIQNLLEALQNVVGSCGDNLAEGWRGVFKILSMVVAEQQNRADDQLRASLFTSAFKAIQLIISDFLSDLDKMAVAAILRLLDAFASQHVDLNMTLTASALYWNLASLILERTDSLDRFSIDINTSLRDDSNLNLWQDLIQSLTGLCKDSRSEVRNAALRILSKIIDASIPFMSPQNLNLCLTQILLPLITFYSSRHQPDNSLWQDSASQVLQDVEQIASGHGILLLKDRSFPETWAKLVKSYESLLKLRDLTVAIAVFQSLSSTILHLSRLNLAEQYHSSRDLIKAVWFLWFTHHPAKFGTNYANGKALSSYTNLLLLLADWSFDDVASFDDATDTIIEAVRASLFGALHDQYTVDVKKLSDDQDQVLKALKLIQRLLVADKTRFAELMLSLIEEMVQRTAQRSEDSRAVPHNSRVPTGIALVTACIEELRKMGRDGAEDEGHWNPKTARRILELCVKLSRSKYSALPVNDKDPLWQKASLLGCECLSNLSTQSTLYRNETSDLKDLGKVIDELTQATIQIPDVELMTSELKPSPDRIIADERFDISRLEELHKAASQILAREELGISQKAGKQYILTLFNHSLVAKPWYNDLTAELNHNPLKDFTSVRRGSIRSPTFPIRREIYNAALGCLFNLISTRSAQHNILVPEISKLAAPYTLLRIAHTLKTFIADQPLRYLEHPHPTLQKELHIILRAFVELRVLDSAFEQSAHDLQTNGTATTNHNRRDVHAAVRADGKTHLRLLFPLMLKFERVWYKMPRLKKGHAWQDHEHGRGVEECLRRWREAVSEGWGPSFD